MTKHFQGIFAFGAPDTYVISITPMSPVPTSVAIKHPAPKYGSPVDQEPNKEVRCLDSRLKLDSATP